MSDERTLDEVLQELAVAKHRLKTHDQRVAEIKVYWKERAVSLSGQLEELKRDGLDSRSIAIQQARLDEVYGFISDLNTYFRPSVYKDAEDS